jgi:hypothetical protein
MDTMESDTLALKGRTLKNGKMYSSLQYMEVGRPEIKDCLVIKKINE